MTLPSTPRPFAARRVLTQFAAASILFGLFGGVCQAVPLDLVTIGDPGNAADTNPNGFGAVNYEFQIMKHEVTIGQYVEFLNAAAKTDPYGLWNTNMATDLMIEGISRSGTVGSYTYAPRGPNGVMPPGANSSTQRPITYVSWFDAARFANWMHNGQGSGSTETGAYTLNGATGGNAPARNPGARFYIPTENEWYKAAYYRGSGTNAGYWDFATQSNSAPGNTLGSGSNQANYFVSAFSSGGEYETSNLLTNVGAFTGSPSSYGTFDQSGNVSEWNDLSGQSGPQRGIRGGYWYNDSSALAASGRSVVSATLESNQYGFRLAVPEPSTWVIASSAIAWTVALRFRRRTAISGRSR